MKRALRKHVNQNHDDWDVHLAAVVYGSNTAKQVLRNIERAQDTRRKTFGARKRKLVGQCVVQAGDDVLLSGDAFSSHHQGPCTGQHHTNGGGHCCEGSNSPEAPPADGKFLLDHLYGTPAWQMDHRYASPGAKWQKDLDPLQSSLVERVLDQNRPPGELLVKECLTREDFWSRIGNACLKIVGEAAQRHGKGVHVADLYVVATWRDPQVNLLRCLPVQGHPAFSCLESAGR
ncbi:uncharacterized protein [Nothobranchius furzeri]|uniref:uncharacterized protein n=1 Tax=Nothobranchius furzeri TaxID=105023 RepID=UPI0039047F53